jgi:hypothetical protein
LDRQSEEASIVTAHPPPVPPDQQPKHGEDRDRASIKGKPPGKTRVSNTREQGAPGNTKQNTTNKGLQQGR